MDSPQKPQKRGRLIFPFKRKEQKQQIQPIVPSKETSTKSIDIGARNPCPGDRDAKTEDRENTRKKCLDAAKMLKETIRAYGDKWGLFDLPELNGEPENFEDSQFREKINTLMEARKNAFDDKYAWGRCKHAVLCAVTAFSPFTKVFLTIAKEGQAIPILNPYGLLCGGLLLLITVADKEIQRKKKFSNILEYLSQQFAHLEIVKVLPADIEHREFIINRALDVRSASMKYLAIILRHDASSLGAAVAASLFVGDEDINNSKDDLDNCIQNYSRALNDIFGIRMIIEVREIVKEMAELNYRSQTDQSNQIENKFLVPYQLNPQFTGRAELLENLKEALLSRAPKKFNHRIALHGMGGIGKTQCAIAYVYGNKSFYQRTYWITAVDQTSLISGYQNISKAIGLPNQSSASPIEIATTVISWLNRESNWLLVIDNLDDIKVINGLLPENRPERHTLITTRNPHTIGIPAEPFEVPLLDMDESIELLETLSNIPIPPESRKREQAEKIINELEYLPLAIEQAAAFVRELTHDFSTYLIQYQKDHQDLHRWVPQGNRQYSHSIATVWSMSFKAIQNTAPQAVRLLHVFAFLNPDCILLEFLLAGAAAFPDALRTLIMSQIEMAKTLLELEKFSLIKWDRLNQSVTIHRLVQQVVGDQMSPEESISTLANIIDLCIEAFPEFTTNETRALCRTYQGQVIKPLLRMKTISTPKSALIRIRVGEFLHEDGKYDDSERLLRQGLEIYTSLSGAENLDTLAAMHSLASTYQSQGRNGEAARIQEEVLEKRRKILGDEHPDTLTAMHSLAWTYQAQERNIDAARIQEEVLMKRRKILGEEHADTLGAMHALAWTYQAQGRNMDAAKIQEEVLEKQRKILGEEHPHTLATMHSFAWTFQEQGRYVDAARIQEEVLEKRRRILGEDHPHTLATMHNLASMYQAQGRNADAARIQIFVLEKSKRILGEEHPHTLATMYSLALTYQAQGRNADAAEILEEVLEKRRRILGEKNPHTLATMDNLALTYQAQGKNVDEARIKAKLEELAPMSPIAISRSGYEIVMPCRRCGYQIVYGDQCGNCGKVN